MVFSAIIVMVLANAQPPIDFRCDGLNVQSQSGTSTCKGNVVVSRGDVLMCCDFFEAKASTDWNWERFKCTGNVRVRRGNEFVWANKAEFNLESSVITIRGGPLLERGLSLMTGEEVRIDIKQDRAQISKPRGRISRQDPADTTAPTAPTLSKTCSIKERPDF